MNSEYITASFDTLLSQASDTASIYMGRAIYEIDLLFGDGYAENHPELVAAFMQTAALDYHASATSKVFAECLSTVAVA